MAKLNMDDVMKASFGEVSESIRATFKKTINIKQYETEVYESSSTLEVERPVSGIERMLITSILQAQLEYAAYIQMYNKGYINQSEFTLRKQALEDDISQLTEKATSILGKPVDYLFEQKVE